MHHRCDWICWHQNPGVNPSELEMRTYKPLCKSKEENVGPFHTHTVHSGGGQRTTCGDLVSFFCHMYEHPTKVANEEVP